MQPGATAARIRRDAGGAFREHLLRPAAVLGILLAVAAALLAVPAVAQSTTDYAWTNSTWHHRVGLEITTNTETENWPIERTLNFTSLLRTEGDTGALDTDSIRVYEYSSTGGVVQEVPSQFVPADGYDAASNAVGEVVFTLNGTTPSGTTRQFFVYFDSQQHGPKPAPSYPTNLQYSTSGDNIFVNTSKFDYSLDLRRGDNLTGLYMVFDKSNGFAVLNASRESERPVEYPEFTNGTHDFTFNLSEGYNITAGSVRMTITLNGYRDTYNLSNAGTTIRMQKKYHFYNDSGDPESAFVIVEQNITNIGSTSFSFRSTPAGALSIDTNRTLVGPTPVQFLGNNTDPVSYAFTQKGGNYLAGIANVEESISGFKAVNHETGGFYPRRSGINLSSSVLNEGESLEYKSLLSSVVDFIGNPADRFRGTISIFKQPPGVNQQPAESVTGTVNASTNATVYNRNETVLVTANLTSDPYDLADSVNVTLDRNTSTDDVTLEMTNASGLWTATYDLNETSNTGNWTADVTVYTAEDSELAADSRDFNVTDVYAADLTVWNPVVLENTETVRANLTLQNVREDRDISGASVSCTYDGTPVSNIADDGDGTYSINFTAPSAGSYTLQCTASSAGNEGSDTDTFRAEVAKVVPDVSFVPPSAVFDRINVSSGQQAEFTANVTVPENGTASDTNLSLSPATGWSTTPSNASCGDITPSGYCSRSFNASAPAGTAPGTYEVNVTTEWVNPDDTNGTTFDLFNITVEENPLLSVPETFVNGSVGGGLSRQIGSFTTDSLGNVNLTNVSFACETGEVCSNFSVSFAPPNASTLAPGDSLGVDVTVGVPLGYAPGTYTGRVNASSVNSSDVLNLTVTVIGSTTVDVTTAPPALTADNVTLSGNQALSFDANATNTGDAFAFDVNTTLSPPSGWTTNATGFSCGDLNASESCVNASSVTVPNATAPGDYTVDLTGDWRNPDGTTASDQYSLTVAVEENPVQRVRRDLLEATIGTDENATVGNFTVESRGNVDLSNVSFTCMNGTGAVCDNFTTAFDPVNLSSVPRGENRTVNVTVGVPARYRAGTYTGEVNVSSDGGSDLVTVNVTVPTTRSWTLDPAECRRGSDPVVGTACSPVINNTGNDDINISITPAAANSTSVNTTEVFVPYGTTSTFDVDYNVTGSPEKTFNAVYNVSAVQTATPAYRTLNVTIVPAIPPTIDLNVTGLLRQNETLAVAANVTSESGEPLDAVRATVDEADGDTITVPMDLNRSWSALNTSLYTLDYPNVSDPAADTLTRGDYAVNVTANDSIGNSEFNVSTATVALNPDVFLAPQRLLNPEGHRVYRKGESGTLVYNLSEFTGTGLVDAAVNISIRKPDGAGHLSGFKDAAYTTSGGTFAGEIDPDPTFDLPDDAAPGRYRVWTNASWDDPGTNRTEEIDRSTYFFVNKSGTLDVDWSPGRVWYPGANLTAYAVVRRGDDLVNASDISMTIYDPDGNVFETADTAEFEWLRTGEYRLHENVSDDVDLGTYWARIEVSDGADSTVEYRSFRMVSGDFAQAQFDVRTTLEEHEVPQGDYLDFTINMTKIAGADTDAKVTYWVERGDTTYYWYSEMIYAPVNTTVVVPRNAYIYTDQPTGNYSLQVRVEPLDADDRFTATNSFRVIEANETTVEQPEPDVNYRDETVTRTLPQENRTEPPEANLSILDAPSEINTARGRTFYRSVVVGNTGDEALENLSLSVVGLPSQWISVDPAAVGTFGTDTKETFTVTVDVPDGASLTTFNGTFLATTTRITATAPVRMRIFESMEEKIRADIERVSERLRSIRSEIARLRDLGADVSGAVEVAGEIEATLEAANRSLDEGNTSAALQKASEAESLADEGERIVDKLEAPERREAFRLLPLLVGGLLLLVLILTVVYYVKVRSVTPFEATRRRIGDMARHMRQQKQEEKQELLEEKRKAKRLIELLEAQHEEGVMGDESYQEMKQSAEEKLDRINAKLEDL